MNFKDIKPFSERQSTLAASVAQREHERDRIVKEHERAAEAEKQSATQAIRKLEVIAANQTQAVASLLAEDEFKVLKPLVERCINNRPIKGDWIRLSEEYCRLDQRSFRLLPHGDHTGSAMRTTWRLQ